jgi:hypothetical protein
VARAKRTARAEARRRYRAEQQAAEAIDAVDVDDESATDADRSQTRAAKQGGSPTPPPGQRVGLTTAFRLAIRPVDVRGDLAALPWIATRTKALWLPVVLVVASSIAFAITGGKDVVTQLLFAYMVQTPAIGGVFLAGFLAPRASWLLGAIVGLVSAICYSTLILTVFSAVTAASATPSIAQEAIVSSFLLSPVMGAAFAAAAAWYRRFLALSSPNRGRQTAAKPKRGDGRTRAADTQKAGASRR